MVLVLVLVLIVVSRADAFRVVSASDLHLNFGASPSCQPGHAPSDAAKPTAFCDTPGAFLPSVMGQVECGALAFLVPGDTIRHAYNGPVSASEALSAYQAVQAELARRFASCSSANNGSSTSGFTAPIFAVGNNDMLERYPAPPAPGQDDPWLAQLSHTWTVMQRLSPAEHGVFRQSGFYTVDLIPQLLRVLVLHTNYWARGNSHTGGDADDDPVGGFAWLAAQLARAQHDGVRVWLLGHIPPGIDHYSQLEAYHAQYAAKYFRITGDYYARGVIAASFFGHEHTIQERNASVADAMIYMQGSLGADKGNNPSMRVYDVSRTDFHVADINDQYWDLARADGWRSLYAQSSFVAAFGLTLPLRLSDVLCVASLKPEYLRRQMTNTDGLCKAPDCAQRLRCDVAAIVPAQYGLCLVPHNATDPVDACIALPTTAPAPDGGGISWHVPIIVVGVAVAVTALAMVALLVWRWRRSHRAPNQGYLFAQRAEQDWGLDDDLQGDEFEFRDDISVDI